MEAFLAVAHHQATMRGMAVNSLNRLPSSMPPNLLGEIVFLSMHVQCPMRKSFSHPCTHVNRLVTSRPEILAEISLIFIEIKIFKHAI